MTTLTIKVPSEAKDKLFAIIKELGGEVISKSTVKASSKKARLISEIKQGLKEVKEIREGKSASYTMSDLLNEE